MWTSQRTQFVGESCGGPVVAGGTPLLVVVIDSMQPSESEVALFMLLSANLGHLQRCCTFRVVVSCLEYVVPLNAMDYRTDD